MVSLTPVTSENWRDVIAVRATETQRDWVADVTFYLCLSTYGDVWRSCAVLDGDDVVVGHVMWGVDPEDDSHWLGGLVIDGERQGRGLGRATVEAVLALWEQEPALSDTPYTQAALSVSPDNTSAIALYTSLGFKATGEMSDDELVMRRPYVAAGLLDE